MKTKYTLNPKAADASAAIEIPLPWGDANPQIRE